MVIVCKDADFSASGLGKIRYKSSVETELFSSYLTRVLTTDQKIGLDTFVDGLKTSGAWTNIQQLYIPMVSFVSLNDTALLNSFIDIKKSYETGTSVKNTYATNALLQNNYKFANKGIERKTAVSNYTDIGKMFRLQEDVTTLKTKDSHLLMYKIGGTFVSSANPEYIGFPYSATLKNIMATQQSTTQGRFGTSATASNNGVGLLETSASVLIGYSSKDGVLNKKGDSFSTYNISAETDFTLDNPIYFGLCQLGTSIGLVSIGKGLTPEQVTTFNSGVQLLASNF